MQIVLFVTDACSMCDEALNMVFASDQLSGHILDVVDIMSDAELFNTMAQKIPVAQIGDHELDWPFTDQQIAELANCE